MNIVAWVRQNGQVVAIEAAVNLVAPALIYAALHTDWGDVPALLASAGPPLVWSLVGLIRNRRIDALSIMVLVGMALSLVALIGGGSVRFLQLREKLVTALIAAAFLGSAAIGRPLIGPLARATVARESADSIMVMTLVWGIGLAIDFALSVALIYSVSVVDYLVIGPIVGYITIGGLTVWTVLYRRYRARSAKVSQRP